ncbi:MAG: hypothetical protein ACP5HU_08400 [Phycisphaerae bacterium]
MTGLIAFTQGDWVSFLAVAGFAAGLIAFVALSVLLLRWMDRRAARKKQPVWKGLGREVDLDDTPVLDDFDADDD